MPSGTNGQILYLINADAQDLSGAVTTKANTSETFVYAGGAWRRISSVTSITGSDIQDGTITSADIQDNTITGSDIADNAIENRHMADNAIGSAEIIDNSIATGDIQNGAVTPAKVSSTGASSGQVLTYNGTNVAWADATATGVGSVKFARKTSDESLSSSTTLQNDDDLKFSIGANETWEFDGYLDARSSYDDIHIKMAVKVPSGATIKFTAFALMDDGNDGDIEGVDVVTSSGTATQELDIHGNNKPSFIHFRGIVVNSSNSGDVQVQWAQESWDNHSITVKENSYIKGTRVQ
jgi:hypothetical protein